MKGLSIAKRLEGIIAAREEAEQKQKREFPAFLIIWRTGEKLRKLLSKVRFVDLNAVGILVRTWSRVNAEQEPFKAVFDKEKKSFISTTIFESVSSNSYNSPNLTNRY